MTQKKRRMSLRGRIMVLTLTGIIISVLLVGCVSMARGIPGENILKYGLAFQGKECLIRKG